MIRNWIRAAILLAVCAMMASGFAGASFAATTEATPAPAAQPSLSAPQSLMALNVNKSGVTLQWNAVEGAAKYKVYYATSLNGKYKLIKTLSATKLLHKIKLGNSTKYYRVAAVYGKKTGPLSEALSVALPSAAGAAKSTKSSAALDAEYARVVNQSYVISGLDQKYLDALNADRAAVGVKPVQLRADLVKTATIKAADMHSAGVFYGDHRSPTYGSPIEMGEKYLGYQIAENIMDNGTVATGLVAWQNTYADAADCGQDQFMNSQSHRTTRLDPKLKYVGMAMYYDGARLCICEHYSIQ